MRQAYHVIRDRGNCGMESTTANQRYGCQKFLILARFLENHMRIRSTIPGFLYKFKSRNVLTFENNKKFMDEVSFAVYFHFEKTN